MTSKSPLVSIICTNYNKGDWIADAIESFLHQNVDFTYEILIIDDHSADHSPKIIREYSKKYPKLLRVFFNEKNLGITKTWIKVCKEAKGKYIARCDGDDYWIDEYKLQKQVDLLKADNASKWCSTDYDIITPEGVVTHQSAFETGLVDRSTSYAQMLATKGFTMSSTWLVDTELMQAINTTIDSSAVDDTFNIQLDLFNRTKLTYLPEATVVYRLHEGSDSRPIEMDKIIARNERLLKTQLEYIKKYKNVDYDEILQISLRRDMMHEMLAVERLQLIYQQRAQIHQLEESLVNITESKGYKLVTSTTRLMKGLLRLPLKAIRKLLWIQGRHRYKKFYNQNTPSEVELLKEREAVQHLPYQPLISIVVPTYNTDARFFTEMMQSVKNQTYHNWQVVFIDDASPDGTVRKLIKQEASTDPRVVYRFLKKNRHISGATNEGFKLSKGEFISLLDHDDVLHPSALFEIVRTININKRVDFIYTDEDKINEKNQHIEPFIKPDWNEELLFSVNYITHFTTIRKSVIEKIEGEIGLYNGAQDWDLYLRATHAVEPENIAHIPKILYSWRIHDSSTAKNMETKPYVFEAQRKLLEDNFRARGLKENEFTVRRNRFMNGAWDVSYKNQDISSLHKAGTPVRYDKIKGLAMTRSQIIRNFGRISLSTKLYKNCQYHIAHDNARSASV